MATDPLDAAVVALQASGTPLHWTVLLDRALRDGAIDPFTTPNVRGAMLGALRRGVRAGTLRRTATGVYALAEGGDTMPGD